MQMLGALILLTACAGKQAGEYMQLDHPVALIDDATAATEIHQHKFVFVTGVLHSGSFLFLFLVCLFNAVVLINNSRNFV